MNDKSKLTDEELESDSMDNPINQNHDYGGNFLDKVRNRLERRKQRKEAVSKFAQQQPSEGDAVKIMSGNYQGMRGVIDEISSSKYIVNMVMFGREVAVDIDRTETLEIIADSRNDDYKIGDQVLVSREEGYEPLPAVVNSKSISNIHDDTEKLYEVRLQYDGKWYNKQVSERRLQPNPEGNVPLGETDTALEGSESTEDPSLVPVYSDRHGYFVFPKYENDLYPKDNDLLVEALNDKYVTRIAECLVRFKDSDIIPVIENAAVLALLNKSPDKLISSELYDYIKSNYPKHFHDAINAEVIGKRRLWAIPKEKKEDVYDMYTEPVLQAIFSYEGRAFNELFIQSRRHQKGGSDFGFLLDRLLEGNAPEFKEALRANIDMLSGPFIFRAYIYAVLPEESKEKILKYLEDYAKDKPNEILLVSNYIPEALELLEKSLDSNFSKIFKKNPQDFVERFSPEERQALYPKLLENKPTDIFHAIRFAGGEDKLSPAKSRAAAFQIIKEVPQNIWNQLALECFKTKPEYFFTIEAPKFVEFSEEVLKAGYDYLMDNLQDIQHGLKDIFKSESFNELLKKYGISEERFLSITKNMDGRFLEQSPALYKMLAVVSGKLASKINENQELSEEEGIFIKRYFEDELFLAGPQSPQTINAFLETEHPVIWSKAPTRKSLGNAAALFKTIHKIEEPFLSEKAFRNLLEVADNKNVISSNYGPSKPFVDWMPMSKMAEEPTEEILRFYAEKLVTEKPEQLFKSSGLEKIKAREYVGANNMDDEALVKDVYGFRKEDLDGPDEKTDQAIKMLAGKIREEMAKQKASGAIPLIVRFPDLLLPAIQNFDMKPGFISLHLDTFLRMSFPDGNIPYEVADAILNRMYRINDTLAIILDPSEYEVIQKIKQQHPKRYDQAIRSLARLLPGRFLNSKFGRDRENYNEEIIAAIKDLSSRNFGSYGNKEDYLSEETKQFFVQDGNEDLVKILLDRAVEIDRVEDLMYNWPGLAEKIKQSGMRIMPVAALRDVSDLESAKNMFSVTRNDLPIENLPEEIRISKSIYQTEQRAYSLEDYTRYTISNNNVDPTPPLYDIGKKLVHAGDGVAHTNVGAAGFTNSWALVSFAEVDGEDTIIIEQYQSDYPPVLFHLFSGQSDGEYGTGKDTLQRLIREYGDQEAIKQYIEEKRGDVFTYPQEQLDRSLDQFDWTARTAHNLNRAGFTVVEQLVQRSKNDLLETGLFGRKSVSEIQEVLEDNGLSLRDEDREPASPVHESEIELPIELAPTVKDARTHFEYISKAYPYLAIANTIKVAQNQQMNNIYIDRDAAGKANIGNEDKARKLYQEIPAAIGDEYHDEKHDLNLWKIPATDAVIQVLKSMIQEVTGKDKDYDFSLTPSQNQELKEQQLQEQRKKKQQWSATPEKQEQLNKIENNIRKLLPIETPSFYSPQQALRFLGQEVKGKVVPKKRFNSQFSRIMRDLGMLARASRRQKRLLKLAIFMRKEASSWKEGVPNFDWLDNGSMKKIKSKAPKAFDEFIDLNSDKFAEWDPVKYLGSGVVGDAWLLADNRVLKIFDDSILVSNQSDSSKYEDIMEAQHNGTADPNLPMIYEHGELEMPSEFYSMKGTSYRGRGYSRLNYVIMEKVSTPNEMAKKYIDYNPYLQESSISYDEEADEWIEREYIEGEEIPPLSESEIPRLLIEEYRESLYEGTYDKFIQMFANFMFDHISTDMSYSFETNKEAFDEEMEKLDEGEEIDPDLIDFRKPDIRNQLINEMIEYTRFASYYSEKNIKALERVLNLPSDWKEQLAAAITNNMLRGRFDIHGGNFGFRNGKVVFFDA